MSAADFTLGLEARVNTHFVTARAAARHMVRQRSGAILMVTATPDRVAIPQVGSFGVANAALEGLTRTLATELSPQGVRVICLRSAGSPDATGVQEAFGLHAANAARRWRPSHRAAKSASCSGGCRRRPRSPIWRHSWHRTGPAR